MEGVSVPLPREVIVSSQLPMTGSVVQGPRLFEVLHAHLSLDCKTASVPMAAFVLKVPPSATCGEQSSLSGRENLENDLRHFGALLRNFRGSGKGTLMKRVRLGAKNHFLSHHSLNAPDPQTKEDFPFSARISDCPHASPLLLKVTPDICIHLTPATYKCLEIKHWKP